jgi:hypothetical protein
MYRWGQGQFLDIAVAGAAQGYIDSKYLKTKPHLIHLNSIYSMILRTTVNSIRVFPWFSHDSHPIPPFIYPMIAGSLKFSHDFPVIFRWFSRQLWSLEPWDPRRWQPTNFCCAALWRFPGMNASRAGAPRPEKTQKAPARGSEIQRVVIDVLLMSYWCLGVLSSAIDVLILL